VSRSRDPQRSPFAGVEAEATSSPARESQVWQALGQINPQLREAIVLRYWADHTYTELAHILRCPLPTAQSRVRLGYEQMTKLLASAAKPTQGE
jgi:RNA polymerase sigma-70 factor (ECF subfamily)